MDRIWGWLLMGLYQIHSAHPERSFPLILNLLKDGISAAPTVIPA